MMTLMKCVVPMERLRMAEGGIGMGDCERAEETAWEMPVVMLGVVRVL